MGQLTQTVLTHDRIRIAFDWYAHASRTAIIVCPGFFQSKQARSFQRMSQAFTDRYDVVCMDFRGHGRSGGWYTFSSRESADLEAVLEWMQERYTAVGLIGFSMAGAIAITTLSQRRWPVVRSLISVSAPSTFDRIEFKWWHPQAIWTGCQALGPGTGCRPGSPFLPKPRPLDLVAQLPVPTLFVHGTRDPIVGHQHSKRLYAAAREPKRLAIIDRGRHAEFLFRDDPQRFMQLVNGWWDQTLQ